MPTLPILFDYSHSVQGVTTGRLRTYNPVVPFLEFESDASLTLSPGKQHASIREAMDAAEADGARSILDIERISTEADFGVAVLLPPERLEELYGTDKPTREMVAENMDFFEDVDRGHAIYCVLFRDGNPSELFFAGVSYD